MSHWRALDSGNWNSCLIAFFRTDELEREQCEMSAPVRGKALGWYLAANQLAC
jgi:hypothetical protein